MVRNRWQASALHLAISVLIAVTVLLTMLELWYPGPLFQAMGGNGLFFIVIGVDVIIGPLITLVIFRRGKRGLKFDLAAIALLQLAALAYGIRIVYLAHPAYLVFVKDRFEVAMPATLAPEEVAKARFPQFRSMPWGAPVLAAADFPADPKERSRLLDLALAGHDLQDYPKYWAPYEERRKEVLSRAQTIERLHATDPDVAKVVDAYLAKSGTKPADVRYLGLRARRAWIAVLIDPQTAEPVKMLFAEAL
jgi:hypothetical protein